MRLKVLLGIAAPPCFSDKDRKISYTDAIGYIYVLRNKLVFLTGDKEFENIDNVEFIIK